MATARKKRDRKFPQAEFEILLTDAVALLIRANQIAAGDRWQFRTEDRIEGETLVITRTRAVEELPIDPEDAVTGEARRGIQR